MPPKNNSTAQGRPPVPLTILTLADTRTRLKNIMGAQSGTAPSTITDNSPTIRANILAPRLRAAINVHFFPRPLNGIVGFPAGEKVIETARRIKATRDPQLSGK